LGIIMLSVVTKNQLKIGGCDGKDISNLGCKCRKRRRVYKSVS
jgi:hypothetical protein